MAKQDEVDYIDKVASVEHVRVEDFKAYLANKPFSDPQCGTYLMDIAQAMRQLPPPPARLLDIGVGSGWTSELFAMRGYEVLGLDISPDMIEIAKQRTRKNLSFAVCDYEIGPMPTGFNIAVIYDALHHAEDESQVVRNAFDALVEGGVLVTIEPGTGHSTSADSIAVMRKFGTTEKDMPFSRQREILLQAGFRRIEQYVRLSQLPMSEIATWNGATLQVRHAISLTHNSAAGLSSVVVATKANDMAEPAPRDDPARIIRTLFSLGVAHDRQVHDWNAANGPLAVPVHELSGMVRGLLRRIKAQLR